MSTRVKNKNYFDDYEILNFYLETTTRSKIKSIQLTFGSMIESTSDTFIENIKKHNRMMRQFFYQHHRDGYYKSRFIYQDGITDLLIKKHKGLFFNLVFFHLEEEYEKSFVYDYFQTLFPLIDDLHKNNSSINFTKYNKHYAKKQSERWA